MVLHSSFTRLPEGRSYSSWSCQADRSLYNHSLHSLPNFVSNLPHRGCISPSSYKLLPMSSTPSSSTSSIRRGVFEESIQAFEERATREAKFVLRLVLLATSADILEQAIVVHGGSTIDVDRIEKGLEEEWREALGDLRRYEVGNTEVASHSDYESDYGTRDYGAHLNWVVNSMGGVRVTSDVHYLLNAILNDISGRTMYIAVTMADTQKSHGVTFDTMRNAMRFSLPPLFAASLMGFLDAGNMKDMFARWMLSRGKEIAGDVDISLEMCRVTNV